MVCPNCHKEVDDEIILCPNCSYNIPADNKDNSLGFIKKQLNKYTKYTEMEKSLNSSMRVMIIVLILFIFFVSTYLAIIIFPFSEITELNAKFSFYRKTREGYVGVYKYEIDGKEETIESKYYYDKDIIPNQYHVVITKENNNNKKIFTIIISIEALIVFLVRNKLVKVCYKKIYKGEYEV